MALKYLLRNKTKVFYSSLIIFFFSLYFTARLFTHVRAEVEYLLPPESKVLSDLKEARVRYPQSDILLVFFNGERADEVKRQFNFVQDELERSKHPLVAHVMSNIKNEIQFFTDHRLNYIPLQNWKELHKKIMESNNLQERSKAEKGLALIRGFKDKINQIIILKNMQNFSKLRALPNGDFVSLDGKVRLMVIFHSRPMTNLDDAVSFDKYINQVITRAQESSRFEVKVFQSGIAKAMVAEYRSLWSDLLQSVLLTLFLVFLAVWFFFKNIKILIPLFFVLLLGTFSGFALCSLFFERINSNSAFLCSVVIGNAVNTGIIFLSHLIYLLKTKLNENQNYDQVIAEAFKISFLPTLISAISSSIAFLCLTVNSFRGYYEFGVVGSVGMLLGWVGMMFILPTFVSLERFHLSADFIEHYQVPFARFWSGLFYFVVEYKKKVAGGLLLFCLVSITLIFMSQSYMPAHFLERDMTQLKDRNYNSRKFSVLEPLLNKVFLKREFIPAMVVLTNSDVDAFKLKDAITSDAQIRLLLPELKGYTIWDVLPSNEREKNNIFGGLKNQNLEKWKWRPNITKSDERLIAEIQNKNDYRSLKRDDLPFFLKYFFTEENGNVGKIIHLNFNLNNLEVDLFKIIAVMNRIKAIGNLTLGENHFVISGIIPMLAEMGGMILGDAWKAIVISLVSILLLFFYFYRTFQEYMIVASSFLVTIFFFVLIILLFKIKINILNFIALPLTFGIGVDYSSNVVQYFFSNLASDKRLIQEQLKNSLILTAPFVFMSSLTTMIGFFSLCLSTNQLAIYSFGLLAFLGELVSLFGAFIILPIVCLTVLKQKMGVLNKLRLT